MTEDLCRCGDDSAGPHTPRLHELLAELNRALDGLETQIDTFREERDRDQAALRADVDRLRGRIDSMTGGPS